MKTIRINRLFISIVLASVTATFLLIIVGNAVRVMDGSSSCPDWPTCLGNWTPPPGFNLALPIGVQYTHRALAFLAVLLTGLSGLWAVRSMRGSSHASIVTLPLLVSFGLMLLQSILGSRLVLYEETAWFSAVHLALALLSFGMITASLVVISFINAQSNLQKLAYVLPFSRRSLVSLAILFILLVSGTLVSATNASAACQGWPICVQGLPNEALGWLAFSHRLVVMVAGLMLTIQFLTAWKSQRSQPVLLSAATGSFLLFIGQSLVGAVIAMRNFPADLVGLHASASAALWAVQVVLVVAAGFDINTVKEEAVESAGKLSVVRRVKDFIILSKPIIVLLLLVTTYAGMVVGGKSLPPFSLVFWTLMGGALAAGGSSALNQYIDRETDRAMQRTAKRPIPDGRLKPAEGLAYGLGACLVSFFILAVFVNLLAAVLSFIGMIYYVLLYSIWLKRLTVQNIVIGGGAGAIPPLVGWVAATGTLNIPALFLFAIIFFWTPPHFWALALVRVKDYARGQVPMLPVVRGEVETRRQIFIYTLALVLLTFLLPIFKLSGTVYLVSALFLGVWLIHTAWKVLKTGGNKTAWKMYRYSSMYLAFLMLAMVIDVLV